MRASAASVSTASCPRGSLRNARWTTVQRMLGVWMLCCHAAVKSPSPTCSFMACIDSGGETTGWRSFRISSASSASIHTEQRKIGIMIRPPTLIMSMTVTSGADDATAGSASAFPVSCA